VLSIAAQTFRFGAGRSDALPLNLNAATNQFPGVDHWVTQGAALARIA
jgi:hypothetical protein